jgi:hypothetical protein
MDGSWGLKEAPVEWKTFGTPETIYSDSEAQHLSKLLMLCRRKVSSAVTSTRDLTPMWCDVMITLTWLMEGQEVFHASLRLKGCRDRVNSETLVRRCVYPQIPYNWPLQCPPLTSQPAFILPTPSVLSESCSKETTGPWHVHMIATLEQDL